MGFMFLCPLFWEISCTYGQHNTSSWLISTPDMSTGWTAYENNTRVAIVCRGILLDKMHTGNTIWKEKLMHFFLVLFRYFIRHPSHLNNKLRNSMACPFATLIQACSHNWWSLANNGNPFGNKLQSANKCLSVYDIKSRVTVSVICSRVSRRRK